MINQQIKRRSVHAPLTLILLFAVLMGGCSIFKPRVVTEEDRRAKPMDVQAKAEAELAAGYINLGRYDIAKIEADKAIQLDRYSGPANNINGLLYLKLGEYEKAETYLRNAVNIEPENPDYQNNLALLYCNTSRADEGMRILNLALSNRLYSNPQNSIMNAGICSSKLGRYADAEKYLNQALRYPGVNISAKENLAEVYLLSGRQAQAWKEISELFKRLDPPTPEQYELAIKIAQGSGHAADAEQLSVKLRQDYPEYVKGKAKSTLSNDPTGLYRPYGNYQTYNPAPTNTQSPYPSNPNYTVNQGAQVTPTYNTYNPNPQVQQYQQIPQYQQYQQNPQVQQYQQPQQQQYQQYQQPQQQYQQYQQNPQNPQYQQYPQSNQTDQDPGSQYQPYTKSKSRVYDEFNNDSNFQTFDGYFR